MRDVLVSDEVTAIKFCNWADRVLKGYIKRCKNCTKMLMKIRSSFVTPAFSMTMGMMPGEAKKQESYKEHFKFRREYGGELLKELNSLRKDTLNLIKKSMALRTLEKKALEEIG